MESLETIKTVAIPLLAVGTGFLIYKEFLADPSNSDPSNDPNYNPDAPTKNTCDVQFNAILSEMVSWEGSQVDPVQVNAYIAKYSGGPCANGLDPQFSTRVAALQQEAQKLQDLAKQPKKKDCNPALVNQIATYIKNCISQGYKTFNNISFVHGGGNPSDWCGDESSVNLLNGLIAQFDNLPGKTVCSNGICVDPKGQTYTPPYVASCDDVNQGASNTWYDYLQGTLSRENLEAGLADLATQRQKFGGCDSEFSGCLTWLTDPSADKHIDFQALRAYDRTGNGNFCRL